MLKRALKKFAGAFGYQITRTSFDSDPLMNKEIKPLFNKCKDFTMTSIERLYALNKAVKYVIDSKIPGDFVECGVWKGGSIMAIAYTLMEMGVMDRKIFLYDTFSGMTKPNENDSVMGNKNHSLKNEWAEKQKVEHNEWAYSALPDVKNNVFSTGYPKDNFIFVEGKVEDTLPRTMPSRIALLRLDTDWYESTKHELVNLFPAIVHCGVLIIDDYGWCAGSKKATDDYFSNTNTKVLLNRIDWTGRIGVKL
jgi:O-methyltransferase